MIFGFFRRCPGRLDQWDLIFDYWCFQEVPRAGLINDIWYLIDSVTKIQLGTKVASARCQTWVKWKWPKVRHICKGSFFGMQDKNLKGLITLKMNFTTNPTLLSMGWVNLCPGASIMPDIYQITCCAYNGSWNDESLINMQTYQVGFDRVSTVRKAKNRTLFYYLCPKDRLETNVPL